MISHPPNLSVCLSVLLSINLYLVPTSATLLYFIIPSYHAIPSKDTQRDECVMNSTFRFLFDRSSC